MATAGRETYGFPYDPFPCFFAGRETYGFPYDPFPCFFSGDIVQHKRSFASL
jgi:hypothetical protein